MPEISGWDGVKITMHWFDHPEPHFHAVYAGRWIVVRLSDGAVTRGPKDKPWPKAQLKRLQAWREAHLAELQANWLLTSVGREPVAIAPPEGRRR